MFVDHIRIHAKAGNGGDGCASFRREKYVPKGGPDGGDGGRGGDIVLRPDPHVDNLTALFYEPIIRAKHGGNGRTKQQFGKSAPHKIVSVPIGTLVYRLPEGVGISDKVRVEDVDAPGYFDFERDPEELSNKPKLDPSQLELVADLVDPSVEFVLCEGGKGGVGNVHFKSSKNQTPRRYTEGIPGQEGFFYLELRKIADVGLVGYPNAGKSTLLRAISAAQPKVASYPFTTLTPHIGVVDVDDYRNVRVADIPGLIDGAHRNVGLGHDFLRHIVRCKMLFFVLDMAGSEGRHPLEDLATLRSELKLYDPTLAKKEWLVVANKMDLPEAQENLKAFKRRFTKREVIPVAAASGEGVEALKARLSSIHVG